MQKQHLNFVQKFRRKSTEKIFKGKINMSHPETSQEGKDTMDGFFHYYFSPTLRIGCTVIVGNVDNYIENFRPPKEDEDWWKPDLSEIKKVLSDKSNCPSMSGNSGTSGIFLYDLFFSTCTCQAVVLLQSWPAEGMWRDVKRGVLMHELLHVAECALVRRRIPMQPEGATEILAYLQEELFNHFVYVLNHEYENRHKSIIPCEKTIRPKGKRGGAAA